MGLAINKLKYHQRNTHRFTRKLPHINNVSSVFIGGCTNPSFGNLHVFLVTLDADKLEALQDRRLAGGTAAHERVKHDPLGRCDEEAEVAHQCSGFDGGMVVAGNACSLVPLSPCPIGAIKI